MHKTRQRFANDYGLLADWANDVAELWLRPIADSGAEDEAALGTWSHHAAPRAPRKGAETLRQLRILKRRAKCLSILLAREDALRLAGIFKERDIFLAYLLDLFAGLGEALVGDLAACQDRPYSDRARRLLDLPVQPFLELKQPLQLVVREEAAEKDLVEAAADTVDAAVALNEPHGVPGEVIVDNVASLLKVHAFAQYIRGDDDVEQVLVATGRGVSCPGGESEERRLAAVAVPGGCRDAATVGRQVGVPLYLGDEELRYPVDRVCEVAEDEHLAHVANFLARDAFLLRLR